MGVLTFKGSFQFQEDADGRVPNGFNLANTETHFVAFRDKRILFYNRDGSVDPDKPSLEIKGDLGTALSTGYRDLTSMTNFRDGNLLALHDSGVYVLDPTSAIGTLLFPLPEYYPLHRSRHHVYHGICAIRRKVFVARGFIEEVGRRNTSKDTIFVYDEQGNEEAEWGGELGAWGLASDNRYLVSVGSSLLNGRYINDLEQVPGFYQAGIRNFSSIRYPRSLTYWDGLYYVGDVNNSNQIWEYDFEAGLRPQFTGFQADLHHFDFRSADAQNIYTEQEVLLETDTSLRRVDQTAHQSLTEFTCIPKLPLDAISPGDYFVSSEPQPFTGGGIPNHAFEIEGINLETNGHQVVHGKRVRFASKMVKVFGDGQSTIQGTACQSPFVVRVLDQNGNPREKVQVAWGITTGEGHLSDRYTLTSDDGIAASTLDELDRRSPDAVIRATALGSKGTLTADFNVTATQRTLTDLVILTGNNQSGITGRELRGSLQVLALDQNDDVLPNIAITFAVTAGDGSLSTLSAVTANNGVAITNWMLGDAGTNTCTATSGTHTVTFTATAADIAYSLHLRYGNNQVGIVGQRLPGALVLRVTDQLGEPIEGVIVTWTVLTGEGTLQSSPQTESDLRGYAFARWQLGETVGEQTLEASVGSGDDEVTYTFTATASGLSVTLTKITGDKQTGTIEQDLDLPLTVRATDQLGNPLQYQRVTWATTAADGALPDATLTNSEGVTSADWTLGSATGSQTATATAGTATVTFTATGAAHVYTLQKVGGDRLSQFSNALSKVTLAVRTLEHGRPLAFQEVTWSLPSGATGMLDQTTTFSNASGIATVG